MRWLLLDAYAWNRNKRKVICLGGGQEAGRDRIEHDTIMESGVTTLEEGGR